MNRHYSIEDASHRLREGKLVAFPTETVYGLGANALDDRAVAEIFARKGRPQFNPLIIHVASAAEAWRYVIPDARAEKLAAAFWPGPLTLVLPRRAEGGISLLASAGLETLGIRVPAHPLAQQLLQASRLPLAAPSANRSGRVSPTSAAHVQEEFGDGLPVIDGGDCRVGLESTVLDVSGDAALILRPGAVTAQQVEAVLHQQVKHWQGEAENFASPGMLKSHYAPALPVRLNVMRPLPTEALLAFGTPVPSGAVEAWNLSERGDLIEAAANLFKGLRHFDRAGFSAIAVMPIPSEGIGIAINDRLQRAAA